MDSSITKTKLTDYLIIGAGPAGLQLGLCLKEMNRDYLILESGKQPGSFFKKYPRHNTLISINKVNTGFEDAELNLRWDWNSLLNNSKYKFSDYSKEYFPKSEDMCNYLKDFANNYNLNIHFNTDVINIKKDGGIFKVVDNSGKEYNAKYLVIATGFNKENLPKFTGIEYCEKYSEISINSEDYLNQRVLIVGKGNSAFETAEHIQDKTASVHLWSPEPLKQSWDTHYVGNVRSVNSNLIDTYQLKAQNTINRGVIKNVEKSEDGFSVDIAYTSADEVRTINYDRILLCTGFKFDSSIFDKSLKIDIKEGGKFPLMKSNWESTSISDLYFAGTLMHSRDYQKTMSGFIHGFRYNVVHLSKIFELKNHGVDWDYDVLELDVDNVVETIFNRLNKSSAMFLQPSFIGDLLIVKSNKIHYYQDVPIEFFKDTVLKKTDKYYTLTLEYGKDSGYELIHLQRDIDQKNAHLTGYIHPIIRRFESKNPVKEHHVFEDLENEWYLDRYILPVKEFFEKEF